MLLYFVRKHVKFVLLAASMHSATAVEHCACLVERVSISDTKINSKVDDTAAVSMIHAH